jgi:hypothetical protein
MRGRRGHGTGKAGAAQHERRSESRKRAKMRKVMKEYKSGSLHSGSKHGKPVKNRKQAIAIGMSEARKAAHGGY